MKKTGLIMEGGSMRGLFTCGVIDTFMKNGIDFDGAIGVSAGAAFGCNIKSKQIGRGIRYNKKYCKDKRYASIRNLIKEGNLFSNDFCYHQIPDTLDPWDRETFKSNPMDFYVVATNVETGCPEYHKMIDGAGDDLEWLRASASIPMLSKVVVADGYKLLDGGISDSIPLKYFESIGYNRNVVIETQVDGYQKGENKLVPLAKIMLKKYPKMIEALKSRHIMYNEEKKYIKDEEQKGNVLVLRPYKPLEVDGIVRDENKLQAAYDQGVQVAEKNLEKVKEFLGHD